ncbi:MAG: hypothetical protein KKB50_06790 [Planctomycetes bacterium]|nr:hypothetical protein [Planctomycetota bacterium]
MKVQRIAREMVRLRGELLRELHPRTEELELTVAENGDAYTVRVFWQDCILVGKQPPHRKPRPR